MYYYVGGERVDVDVLGPLSEDSGPPSPAEAALRPYALLGRAATQPSGRLSRREAEYLASMGLKLRDDTAPFAIAAVQPESASGSPPAGARMLVRDKETKQLHDFQRQLVVRFAEDMEEAAIASLLAEHDLLEVRKLWFARNQFVVMTADANESACARAGELHETLFGRVHYIEPVSRCSFGSRHKPNDALYGAQWQWNNRGVTSRAVAGADVCAEAAWDVSKGAGTLIAVVDRGFHVKHPDIAANIDPESSGHFHGEGQFCRNLRHMPSNSHGTFCAAQAAACADDEFGTCGIAPDADLMLLCLDAGGGVSQLELAMAIAYAVSPRKAMGDGFPKRGADALTCAEGPENGYGRLESVLKDALEYAFKEGRNGKGMPVFWAVANRNVPISNDKIVSHEYVVAVGSSTNKDTRADLCAYGEELAFLAPGENVFNARGSGLKHGPDFGTSFATPIGAGIAALMLSINPELSVSDIRDRMKKSCRKVPDMAVGVPRDNLHGFGVIDAKACVDAAV